MRFAIRPPHLIIAAAFACSATASLHAQRSTSRGLSLGLHVQGVSLEVENGDARSGGGLGARVGYGFNRIVTGFIHVDGAQIDIPEGSDITGTWSMAHAEIGARFHFANSLRRWVPYLETSIGGRAVTVDDAIVNDTTVNKVSFNGGSFTLGGGLSVFFKKSVALDVSLKLTGGTFNEVDFGSVALRNIDIDASSARFGVGVIWWP
jgi:opacity protein-like surface antigen